MDRRVIRPSETASQRRIVSEVCARVEGGPGSTVVLYGSRAYGVHHGESDADVMVLHPAMAFESAPKRKSVLSDGVATSLYELTWDHLKSDALFGTYGGYFVFKLCAPTVSSDPQFPSNALTWPVTLLKRTTLLGDGWDNAAPDERLARFYQGVITIYPSFRRSLARLYSRPAVWSDLWAQQRRRLMRTRPLNLVTTHPRLSLDRLRASFYACGEEMHPDDSFVDLYDGKEWTAEEQGAEEPLLVFLKRQGGGSR